MNFPDIGFFAICFRWFKGIKQALPVACGSKKLMDDTFYNMFCWIAAQLRKIRIVPVSVGFWYHIQEIFFCSFTADFQILPLFADFHIVKN